MLTLLWMLACDAITVTKESHDTDTMVDQDDDGFLAEEDCNDTDSSIYPGADETKGDGKDSNCDGFDDT